MSPSASFRCAFRTRVFLLVLVVALGAAASGCQEQRPATADSGRTAGWDHYGGDVGGQRHSALDQITPANVDDLEVAWVFNHGDVIKEGGYGAAHGGSPASTTYQNTPILVGETLYTCSPFNKVIALDANTGEEQWRFDPEVDTHGHYLLNCRGVSAWTDSRAQPGRVVSSHRPGSPHRASLTSSHAKMVGSRE